jgi:hypothetical protein
MAFLQEDGRLLMGFEGVVGELKEDFAVFAAKLDEEHSNY